MNDETAKCDPRDHLQFILDVDASSIERLGLSRCLQGGAGKSQEDETEKDKLNDTKEHKGMKERRNETRRAYKAAISFLDAKVFRKHCDARIFLWRMCVCLVCCCVYGNCKILIIL